MARKPRAADVEVGTTETLESGNNESLERTRIDGGWLYRARVWELSLPGGGLSNSIVFVPDDPGTGTAPPEGSGGIPEAPEDGVVYGRMDSDWTPAASLLGAAMEGPFVLVGPPEEDLWAATKGYVDGVAATLYPASNPDGYQTAADLETALVPFALVTSVPDASDALPIMDGVAASGTDAAVARADHVHPVDTSRYGADNPDGYQTAADLTTALEPYALSADVTTEVGAAVAAPRMGVTDGSDAGLGEIGEYIAVPNQTGVQLTTNVPLTICSIDLTPGVWEIWGSGDYQPASTKNLTMIATGISPTQDVMPTLDDIYTGVGVINQIAPSSSNVRQVLTTGQCRANTATPLTLYLVGQCTFSGGTTITAMGYICARRVR